MRHGTGAVLLIIFLGGAYLELLHADSLAVISCLLGVLEAEELHLAGRHRISQELRASQYQLHPGRS